MMQWATKQIKSELKSTWIAASIGVLIIVLGLTGIMAFNAVKDILRTHEVSSAAQMQTAIENNRIAQISYDSSEHLGYVTLETTRQSEISFMAGGAYGSVAVPGSTSTALQDYQLWALTGHDFTALCFSKATALPQTGALLLDPDIRWLTDSDRRSLQEEFSEDERPAYVFLLRENTGSQWLAISLMLFTLIAGAAWILWLSKSHRAMHLTKFWKKAEKAGVAERVIAELDNPLHSSMGFAVSNSYVCLSQVILPREGMKCEIQWDDDGDAKLLFSTSANRAVYYPEKEEIAILSTLLKDELA